MFVWGDPIWVDSGASPTDLKAKCGEVERALNQITCQADRGCAVILRVRIEVEGFHVLWVKR